MTGGSAGTGDDLVARLGRQETPNVEWKRDAKDRDLLSKAICALANDLGSSGAGHLVIGVDKHGTPYPVGTADGDLLKVTNLRNEGRILPVPSLVVRRATWDGEPVIHVEVQPSISPPVAFDGRIWVRPGPSTRVATPDDERVLSERRRAGARSFDESPVPGCGVDELDLELFASTYLRAAVDPAVLIENERPVGHHLASLRLVDPASGQATVLGVLVLGLDPTAWLPGAYVQFVRYLGTDTSDPIGDDKELRGNLVDQLDQLDGVLKANIRTAISEPDGLRQQAIPQFPHAALRELVLNALTHRNYESSNSSTRILWFDDRVEITNPGGPYGSVTVDNFSTRNDYRNPGVAAALKHLGYVNRFGRGIGLVQRLLLDNGNPPAIYDVNLQYWNVVVRERGR